LVLYQCLNEPNEVTVEQIEEVFLMHLKGDGVFDLKVTQCHLHLVAMQNGPEDQLTHGHSLLQSHEADLHPDHHYSELEEGAPNLSDLASLHYEFQHLLSN
jgi:hypothetical protein